MRTVSPAQTTCLDNPAASRRYGATLAEWTWTRGLREADLLPTVCDFSAKPHKVTDLKTPGKVPTRWHEGCFIGIPDWPRHQATKQQVEGWQREDSYGICVIARRLRGIDIDIPNRERAKAVEDFITDIVGRLPARRRSNSGKCLLMVRVEGQFTKRVIKTPHETDGKTEIIEILGNGQQFVACGTHPSGVRYEWDELGDVPTLTMPDFEALVAALQERFGVPGGVSTSKVSIAPARARQAGDAADPDVAWLYEHGWVTGEAADGRLDVRCPWEDQHTTETGASSSSYYPAGVGGQLLAGYSCLHSHCSGRTIFQFRAATGLGQARAAEEFEDCSVAVADAPELLPAFERDKTGKSGKILPTRNNLAAALERSDVAGMDIRFDEFQGCIMLAPHGTEQWRPIKDTDYTAMAKRLETGDTGFKSISAELMREMVRYVADHRRFDSAQTWLHGKTWDGVPRVETFLSDTLGAADTPYTRAVSRYTFTALAGRVLQPGIKADMVPVLVGAQGRGKSSTVAAISPSAEFFHELDLGKDEADQAREMRGKLVIELGELRGLRLKQIAELKSFISRQADEWVPKYQEFPVKYARRSLFIGTTNTKEFLVDDTGHRRWLPVEVPGHDSLEARITAGRAIERDRDQLWAEGAAMFEKDGIAWQAAEELAKAEHGKFEVVEPWAERIEAWLAWPASDDGFEEGARGDAPFTIEQVLISAIGVDLKQINPSHRRRVASVLRSLGYTDGGGERRMRAGTRAVWWERAQEFAYA